jgi:hypothetical protein
MFSWEVQVKRGRGWQNRGVITGADSIDAARRASRIYRAARVRVRPDYSRDVFYAYRFKLAKLGAA